MLIQYFKGYFLCVRFCIIIWGETQDCCKSSLRTAREDVLGGPVVQNPACNAEDTGSVPGQGTKIPGAVEQPRGVQLPGRTGESTC